MEKNNKEYKVEEILNSRKVKRKYYYLIKWKGYSTEHNLWEPLTNIENATEELDKYYQKYLKAEKPKYIDKWIKDQEEVKQKGKHTAKRRIIAAINKLKIQNFAYPKDNKLHIEPEDLPKPNTMQ